MIWSVSTAERFSGAAMPVWVVNFSMSGLHGLGRGVCRDRVEIARARQRAPHGGRGGDERRDQVRAAALALTAFEVAVAGRGAALPGCELIGVHAEAHRAAGEAPLRAEVGEDLVETLCLGLEPDAG